MRLASSTLAAAAVLALSLPAMAHPITYIGTLSNLGEPPPADLSLGTGSVTVVFDDDAFTMDVHVSFSGLTGTTTASHIHCCTAAAGTGNAGVATPVPTFPGFPLGVQSGTYDQSFDMTVASSYNPAFVAANGGTVLSAFAALATGISSGKAYLNIHTTFVPGGEIRTFLTPVPEPETYALMLAGLGVVGWAARARRRA